jgi:hypothetical protein
MGLFQLLFGRLAEAEPDTMRTFTAWALQRDRAAVHPAGAYL